MKIYDTKARKIVEFTPRNKEVNIYVCGITPYDSAHLGHIFTFLLYDILQRRLENLGHEVKIIRNITDIDEPIFVKAREINEDYEVLAKRETANFVNIMKMLNFRDTFAEPLASEYIGEMADAVQQLLDNNQAYRLGKDVYFDVKTSPKFGEISQYADKLKLTFMAERGGDPGRPDKRNPLDFLLWRGVDDPNDRAAWESSVGYGRPGWHIECSVMSSMLVDLPLDIHGGGMDLIFPHHDCELVQSESLFGRPLSLNWLHVAPLLLGGEKMSKSIGNLVFASDLLKDGSPAALRLSLMQYSYGIGGEWRDDIWQESNILVKDIQEILNLRRKDNPTGLMDRVCSALDDNLDMPLVVDEIKQHVKAQGNSDELCDSLNLLGVPIP